MLINPERLQVSASLTEHFPKVQIWNQFHVLLVAMDIKRILVK